MYIKSTVNEYRLIFSIFILWLYYIFALTKATTRFMGDISTNERKNNKTENLVEDGRLGQFVDR